MPKEIDQYEHTDKTRPNNPPVGLATLKTDPDAGKKTYAYDPHLNPSLQWAGKAGRSSFSAPTVSVRVHEGIDPLTIIEAVRRQEDDPAPAQLSLFERPALWRRRRPGKALPPRRALPAAQVDAASRIPAARALTLLSEKAPFPTRQGF